MNINLHIERLILDGISIEQHQRPVLKTALEAELGRLLANNGIASDLQRSGALHSLRAGSMEVENNGEPSHLGQQIAQAVHGGLNR